MRPKCEGILSGALHADREAEPGGSRPAQQLSLMARKAEASSEATDILTKLEEWKVDDAFTVLDFAGAADHTSNTGSCPK